MKALFPLSLLITAISLSACVKGESDSEDIRTSGLHASININASEDDRSEVTVRLRVGDQFSDTYLSLTNGDRLQATLNDSTTEDIDIKTGSSYRGSFNTTGAGAENASYRVSFLRPNDTDALNSVVTMPPTLSNLSSNPSDSFSRSSEVLTLTWNTTAQNELIPLRFSGDCISNLTINVNPSPGIYALNPSILTSNSTQEENCEIEISASVTNTGTLDTAYGEGGAITATRTSSFSVMSTP